MAGTHHDLVIIGAGSGNSMITSEMNDWSIGLVEEGVFGGTCLNRGCIPTKMFVQSADVAFDTRDAGRYGVHTRYDGADWPSIRDRVFGRIDPIAEGGKNYRFSLDNVTVYPARGRFVGPLEMEADGCRFTADRFVIAAGARPMIPAVPGLDTVAFHTSDSIMRVDQIPDHLIILGGGFIANELAHVFGSLGSRITIINRSNGLLTHQDDDISRRYTELAAREYDAVLGAMPTHVRESAGEITVEMPNGRTIVGDALLVATGRTPNGDTMDVETTGLALGPGGEIVVDEFGRTAVEGIWAIGDVNGRHMLKHMANGEARVVTHNLLHPNDLQRFESRPAPSAVFAHPQVATVGVVGRDAPAGSVSIVHDYAGAAWGWALEDTTSFCKLIGDPRSGLLLGAHIIGRQASTLVSLLVQGMYLGNTVRQMAQDIVYIHPAPSEVVEQALLKLLDAFAEAS